MAYTLTPKCPAPPPDPDQSPADVAMDKAERHLKSLLDTDGF